MQLPRSRSSSSRLDAVFLALANPTRRAILARLASGEASVNELAAPHRMSQPAISKHLRVLERAGLVRRRPARGRRGDRRERPRIIEGTPLAEVDQWLGDFRKFWAGSFAKLDALLDEMQTQAPPTGPAVT